MGLSPAAAGRVTLVGAGPGLADLLTVRAVKVLRRSTVALVDDLVDTGVLRYLRRGARVVPVGRRGGCVSTPQSFIHRLMVAEARRGEQVVRLKGGDPFVFGRGGEEVDALREAGIEVDVISGLTAGIAGPAAIGIPVTDRRCAPGVVLVTGHSRVGGEGPDWAALARCGLTLVIYMGTQRAAEIVQALRAGGLAEDTPASVISAAHTARQRRARCTLGSLVQSLRAEPQLDSPAVLVIGAVAARGRRRQSGPAAWSKPTAGGVNGRSSVDPAAARSRRSAAGRRGQGCGCRRGSAERLRAVWIGRLGPGVRDLRRARLSASRRATLKRKRQRLSVRVRRAFLRSAECGCRATRAPLRPPAARRAAPPRRGRH
jgi:uroporphyrin-III C-methyltransferase